MKRRSAEELEARNMFWIAVGVTCAWAAGVGGFVWDVIANPSDSPAVWAVILGTLTLIIGVAGIPFVPASWMAWASERRKARRSSVSR